MLNLWKTPSAERWWEMKDHSILCSWEPVSWERLQPEDSLLPCWEGPHQIVLTNSWAARLRGTDSWVPVSHLQEAPDPRRPGIHAKARHPEWAGPDLRTRMRSRCHRGLGQTADPSTMILMTTQVQWELLSLPKSLDCYLFIVSQFRLHRWWKILKFLIFVVALILLIPLLLLGNPMRPGDFILTPDWVTQSLLLAPFLKFKFDSLLDNT